MNTEVVDPATQPTVTQPVIDTNAFAQQVVAGLAQSLSQAKPQAQQVDEIDQVVATLKMAGLDDAQIQAHISTALGVGKQSTRLTKDEIAKAKGEVVNFIQNKEVTSTINRVLRSYTKDDELIKEAAETIRQRTMQDLFNGNTAEVVTARNEFFKSGNLDEDAVETIMLKHIRRIEQAADKRAGKSKSTAPSEIKSDTSSRPTNEVDTENFDRTKLSNIQDAVYRANLRMMSKSGLSAEDAEKSARQAALRVKK